MIIQSHFIYIHLAFVSVNSLLANVLCSIEPTLSKILLLLLLTYQQMCKYCNYHFWHIHMCKYDNYQSGDNV